MNLVLNKKAKITIGIMAGLLLFIGAGVGSYVVLRYYETASSHVPKPNQVTDSGELAKLNTVDKHTFCLDFPTTITPPVNPSLYQKMRIDKEHYMSFLSFCRINAMSEEFTRKDKSGENDVAYRSHVQELKKLAEAATFDLYNTTYEPDDVLITKRVIATAPNDAPSIFIEYSTKVDGEFRLFFSKQVIQVYVFDIREFTENDSNCGPVLMYRKSSLHLGSCIAIKDTFLGNPIYKDSDATTVTIGHTRIKVKARNDTEALTILKSMRRATVDQLDFFAKNP